MTARWRDSHGCSPQACGEPQGSCRLDTGAGNGRRERETTVSTRSYIGIQDGETITAIYCHFDGYPSAVGQELSDHYTDPEKVRALVALGDLSVLGAELGKQQDFDAPNGEDWCLAYGRDRGEKGVGAKTHSGESEFLFSAERHGTEYAYLFRDSTWTCFDHGKAGMPLADAIKADGAEG